MIDLLSNKINDITAICEKHKVKSISVFGSAANNKMTTKSDIDFLVHFFEDIDVLDYADNYFSLLEGLEKVTEKK